MNYTKGELVKAALTEIGIADYEFDITPGEVGQGVQKMDAMMALWSRKGIQLGYNYDGGPGDQSGVPTTAQEAVITNLALRLAPSYGKQVPIEVNRQANVSLRALYSVSARPIEQQFDVLPIGAGFKSRYEVFFRPTNKFPWKIEEFDNYSGGTAPLYVDSVGDVLTIDLTDKVDLATATAATIRYRKPSGTEGTWTGVIVDDTIQYTTVAGDLDEPGVWYLQGEFVLPTFTGSSNVEAIRVENVIGD